MEADSRALVAVPHNPIDHLSPQARAFYQFHGVQMIGSEFPPELIQTLYLKLADASYDGGEYLQVLDNQDAEKFEVRATQPLKTHGNVFIIDHAVTFRFPELRKILKENPSLVDRLQGMLKYYQGEQKLQTNLTVQPLKEGVEAELDNMDLLELSNVELPKTIVTLSLINNQLQNVAELISKIQYLNLKVMWLNGNPLEKDATLREFVESKTRIELYNRQFTKNTTDWGCKYAHSRSLNYADTTINNEVIVLNLDNRAIFNADQSVFESFPSLRSLSIKGHSISSAEEESKLLKIIQLPSLVYLYVDQAVQIKIREAVKRGDVKPEVVQRLLVNKHSLRHDLADGDCRLDAICNSIFRLAGCYRLASTEQLDESSCWYVNDQLGSSIAHNDHPNVKLIPFLYAPNNKLDEHVVAFSVMWPITDIKMGDQITRDFLNGLTQARQRSSRLAAWFKLPESFYEGQIKEFDEKMFSLTANTANLLQKFYSENAVKQKALATRYQPHQGKLGVISDYEYINKYLKHQGFEIVNELEKAHIVWLVGAAQEEEWKKYKGNYYLNQFPFESCIVLKHNLASTVQTVFGDTTFLQRTYDLEKELPRFVGDFYRREQKGQDNLWILKPPNMARSMDMIITDNLPLIVRAMETGPKIAQKYIANPVLRRGRKVDLRYILLVKSVSPLTLYLYRNFWIRSANNPYTLDRRQLATYETQFTVMNYGKVSGFQQIKYKDFIEEFQKDYKTSWSGINQKIKKMLRNVFIAVGSKYPEMHDDKSRAYYGIDVMIDANNMEPKLLEITFSPDCKRACEYYPTFYDEVFQTLFLETPSENMERII